RSRAMRKVMAFGGDRANQALQLVKTAGVVTHKSAHFVFVQDEDEGLRVFPRTEAAVEPGDRVEVVGFVEPDGFSPKLVQALLRKVGVARLPAAAPLDLLESDLSSQDATRGEIEAVVLGGKVKDAVQIVE